MAAFEIGCPACRARFDCPTDRAGKAVRCGACANVFPAPSAPPAVPVAVALPVAVARPRPALRVVDAVAVTRRATPAAGRRDRDDDFDDEPRARRTPPGDAEGPKTSPLVYVLGGVGGVLVLALLAFVGFVVKKGSDGPAVAAGPPAVERTAATAQPLTAVPATPPVTPPAATGPLAPVGAPGQPAPAAKVAAPLPNGTPAQAIQMVKGSTAYIRTHSKNRLGMGSGFFAGPPGYVVTNAHVIGFGPKELHVPTRVEIVVRSGETDQKVYAARIVGVSTEDDLALLWVNGTDHPAPLPAPLTFGRTADLVETQEVMIFGFPLGEQLGLNMSVNKTTVSSLRKEKGVVEMVQIADGMTNGNSGGPVTNTRGEVIGVVVAGIKGTPINFAIPGDKAAAFVTRQVAGGGSFELGKLAPLWKGPGR